MKRNRTTLKKTAIGLVFILLVMGAVTLARYTSSVQGQGTATTARFVNESTFQIDNVEMPKQPGTYTEMTFDVANYDTNGTAEVKMTYTFLAETAGNIPLKFTFTPVSSNPTGDTTNMIRQTVEANTETNLGTLNLNKMQHSYKVKIEWPSSVNTSELCTEIEYVRIRIKTKQANS